MRLKFLTRRGVGVLNPPISSSAPGMAHYRVPTAELRPLVNPLDGSVWRCRPISENEIRKAIEAGVRELRPWSGELESLPPEQARRFHIDRVATLAAMPPTDESVVILVDNHTPSVVVRLPDGNHRLAAAYVRGDRHVLAVLAPSRPETLCEVLPGAVPLPTGKLAPL